MTTITRLKTAVNNKNLPILGNDGNLYNYYYGRFVNKLGEYNVTPTETEKNALNALLQDGIDNGWIDKVLYLMPFIGTRTNYNAGFVPLIDKVGDYEVISSGGYWTYNQDDTIKTFGSVSNDIPTKDLPISNDSMGKGLSIFVNKSYYSDESALADTNQQLCMAKKENGQFSHGCLFNPSRQRFGYSYRTNDGLQQDLYSWTKLQEGQQIGFYYSRYINDNNEYRLKRYAIYKGESDPVAESNMTGNVSSYPFNYEDDESVIVSGNVRITIRINMMAFFDPLTVNADDMYNFNQAVFAFTTALGR